MARLVELKATTIEPLEIATEHGVGKVFYRPIKQNTLLQLRSDIQLSQEALKVDPDSRDAQIKASLAVINYSLAFVKAVYKVEDLKDIDGEPVTLEQLHAAEVSQDLFNIIVKGYSDTKEPEKSEEEKNEPSEGSN